MSIPPGASYRASNALVIAKRRLLNLEDPVRIEFKQEWKEGNPLFDWYNRRSSHIISKIQLRKEREGPFFHEYLAFELRDQGGCFRIDRRQLPDEHLPLDCIYTTGVVAYDSIEQMESLDDRSYGSSDCLVEVEFRDGANLARILAICRAVHRHPRAMVYTLQRYNCYFFAQAILLCITRSALDGDSIQLPKYKLGSLRRHVKIHAGSTRHARSSSATDIAAIGRRENMISKTLARVTIPDINAMLDNVLWVWDEKEHLQDVREKILHHHRCDRWAEGIREQDNPSSSLASLAYRRFNEPKMLELLRHTHEKILEERLRSLNSSMVIKIHAHTWSKNMLHVRKRRRSEPKNDMLTATYENMQVFVKKLAIAHSVRVEQYALILRSSADDVARDIKATMEDIWRTVNCWDEAWIF